MSAELPLLGRRYFLGSTVAGSLGLFLPITAAEGSSTSSVIADSPGGGSDTSIHPFQFHAPAEALADLKRRIAATKWPDQEIVADASQGVKLTTMRQLADFWVRSHDWRRAET